MKTSSMLSVLASASLLAGTIPSGLLPNVMPYEPKPKKVYKLDRVWDGVVPEKKTRQQRRFAERQLFKDCRLAS